MTIYIRQNVYRILVFTDFYGIDQNTVKLVSIMRFLMISNIIRSSEHISADAKNVPISFVKQFLNTMNYLHK